MKTINEYTEAVFSHMMEQDLFYEAGWKEKILERPIAVMALRQIISEFLDDKNIKPDRIFDAGFYGPNGWTTLGVDIWTKEQYEIYKKLVIWLENRRGECLSLSASFEKKSDGAKKPKEIFTRDELLVMFSNMGIKVTNPSREELLWFSEIMESCLVAENYTRKNWKGFAIARELMVKRIQEYTDELNSTKDPLDFIKSCAKMSCYMMVLADTTNTSAEIQITDIPHRLEGNI